MASDEGISIVPIGPERIPKIALIMTSLRQAAIALQEFPSIATYHEPTCAFVADIAHGTCNCAVRCELIFVLRRN